MEAQEEEFANKFIDNYIRWFSELGNQDVKIAGGKGASLSEMYNSKFPVPQGFIVTVQAFDFFLTKANLKEKIKIILESVDVEDTNELAKASKEIRELIETQEIPKELEDEILEAYHILGSEKIEEKGVSEDALNILKNSQEPTFVSIRSSATTEDLSDASFAGQQETFLNIKGDKKLIEHIKKCFSSLYTARAIYYRDKKGFKHEESLLAAVVQKMIDSEKSGVVFSKDPTNLSSHIVIEAVYGLGEGIVSGKIRPDHYIVSEDLKIETAKVADKKIAIVRTGSGENEMVRLNTERSRSQVLTNEEILDIANYAVKLEKHYDKPQDIEFAVEAGKIYILQSRPITTLKRKEEKRAAISGNVILEGLGASPGIGVGTVRIINSMDDLHKIKKGDVLVTKMTNPDMVVSMQKSVAIVTDEGGMTAHASIVSREMGIPCVVGTGSATTTLKDGMKITVDGSEGKIYEGEVAETQIAEIKPAVETKRIKLKVILDLPDFAERAADAKIDSIGLLRLEGIIASSGKHPLLFEKENKLEDYTEILEKGLGKIAEHFNSIWIRTSDIRTDEFSSLKGAPEREINPMLGFHGVRFSLKHPKILEAELSAIKKVAEKYPSKKFGIMLPQVILIEEVKEAKEFFNKIKTSNMQFGVMIETPAAVQIIDDICQEVDFISFGTNDLTQYTLAVDRGDEDVQYLYNELNPAIFSQIKRVIGACRRNRIETSICGQAGSKKEMVEFLFKKGINSISVNADAAYEISTLIKQLEEDWEKTKRQEEERIQEKPLEKYETPQQPQIPVPFQQTSAEKPTIETETRPITETETKPTIDSETETQELLGDKTEDMTKEDIEENEDMTKEDIEEKIPEPSQPGPPAKEFRHLSKKERRKLKRKLRKKKRWERLMKEKKEQLSEDSKTEPIEDFDNLERIKDKAEDIQEHVKQENLEKLEEKPFQDYLGIEEAIPQDYEDKKKDTDMPEETIDEQGVAEIEPYKQQIPDEYPDPYEKDEQYKDEQDKENEQSKEKIDEEETTEEPEEEKEELDEELDEEELGDQEGAEPLAEDDIGTDENLDENIGVYNPDEEPKEDNKYEYNYSFDDEDKYSDVF